MSKLKLTSYQALSGIETKPACAEYQVWDERGRLVYVGIADDFGRRWAQHERSSWWLGEVDVALVEVTSWPSREAARFSEAAVINEQNPVYNTARELGSYSRACAEEWPAPVERRIYEVEGSR